MIKWTRRFRLRTRLLFVACILAVSFAGVVIYDGYLDYTAGVRTLRDRAAVAGRVLAAQQEGLEASTQQLLQGLMVASSDQDFMPLLGANCSQNLRKILLSNPVFDRVGVIAPDGRVTCTSDAALPTLDVRDRDYFARAVRTRVFTLSEPLIARGTHATTMIAVQPLQGRGGEVVGLLYAALDLAFLERSMTRMGLPDGARMLLLRDDGTVLLRAPDPEGLSGGSIRDRDAFRRLVDKSPEGVAELVGLDDVPRMVAYVALRSAMPGSHFIWVGIPLQSVRATVLADIWRIAALFAAVLVVLLTVLWIGLERIVIRPVLRLTDAARRMGQGDLSTRTGIAGEGGEIGMLADRLDSLARNLQRKTRALRTLSAGNHTLLHATDEDALLQRMCDVAVADGGYMSVGVFMIQLPRDADVKRVQLVVHAGAAIPTRESGFEVRWDDSELGGGTIGTAIRTGAPSVIHSLRDDPRALPWREAFLQSGFRSLFSAPLRVDAEVIGVLTFATADDGAFDTDEAALLTEMADDLSFGLTNLRQRAALATSARRATRARRAQSAGNRALAQEADESGLLHRICLIAVEHGGYVLAYVTYSGEHGSSTIVARHGMGVDDFGADDLLLPDPVDQLAFSATLETGRMSVHHDLHERPRPAWWGRVATAHPIRAALTLPLYEGSAPIGTLTIVSTYDPSFEPEERELLDELAQDISIGITSIRGRKHKTAAEDAVKRAATHDVVTGLPAQPAMVSLLDAAIATARERGGSIAVLDVYFPRLEALYRSMGYDVGNRVVGVIAARLARCAGPDTQVGRTHIDEFPMIIPGGDAELGAALATSLRQLFEATVELDGAPLEVQPFVGASFFPGHGADGELLLRHASLAAHEAVRRDASYSIYRVGLDRDNPARLKLAGELCGAIERRELVLHYQPKVSLATRAVCGAEALVRWQHPVHGLIPPMEFIPIAEETGQIRELTYLVVELAVRQIGVWSAQGMRPLPVAVNLSARNLQDPRLTDRIEGLLATWGVAASLLHFEVTETALLEEPALARTRLERLRELGSHIYIDDFGTGYSSLNYLVTLPVHALKIDRSFVVQMATRPEAVTVVASVISMAHSLGLKVVAEGVEVEADRARLLTMGCDEIQGYLIAHPLPADAFAAFIASQA